MESDHNSGACPQLPLLLRQGMGAMLCYGLGTSLSQSRCDAMPCDAMHTLQTAVSSVGGGVGNVGVVLDSEVEQNAEEGRR